MHFVTADASVNDILSSHFLAAQAAREYSKLPAEEGERPFAPPTLQALINSRHGACEPH